MTSPFGAAPAVTPVWQDPFVEVIKFGMTHRNVGWLTQGDVEQDQDQFIHKNVFRIRGTIAATNYLRVPRDTAKGTHGLGLTGRYAYIQVRRIRGQHMTIHLDFVTNKKTSLRFTLSSIYHTLRSTGTVLRVPLSLDTRWTVIVVDMVGLLELHSSNQYARDTYRHLKTITLCASMTVRNLFISPTRYSPATLPSALRFPGDFGDQYRWLELPPHTNSSLNSEKLRRVDSVKQEAIRIASVPDPSSRMRRSSFDSTRATQEETRIEAVESVQETNVVTKMSPGTRDSNLRHDRNAILQKADQILRNAGIFDVEADAGNNLESTGTACQLANDTAVRPAMAPKRVQRVRVVSSSTNAEWPDPILELDRIIGFSNDFPRMLLWIPGSSACVYTSSSTIIIREFCDGSSNQTISSRYAFGGSNGSTRASKGSAVSASLVTSAREYFLHGHSSPVCVLAVTNDGVLLASAEMTSDSKTSAIRLWSLASHECITVIKGQAKGVHALCFSAPTKHRLLLCAVGRDECSRTQVFVWDCSSLQQGKQGSLSATVSLMARQTSDFPIGRITFSPYEQQDQYHLVSCGRENVRYWRVNPSSGHLTGCPVILNEYSRGTIFTDLGYDTIVETQPSNIRRVRPLYVTSSLGTLLVVDYDSRQVLCVYQLHDASINCLSVNEGFCVTGSGDCFLRVWPLDFTDFFLEALHEAGVSCLDVSVDGMKVVVGSRNNAIGVLDISDQQYATVLRSHTKEVTAMTTAPWGSPLASLLIEEACVGGVGTSQSELVTASSDGTLRVWDASSGLQLYEFDIQQESVTSLTASPTQAGIVAAGFASGCTRIFDVHRTTSTMVDGDDNSTDAPSSMLREFWQHQSPILHIAFDSDAQHLYTSGAGQQLCLYDAREQDYMPLKMLLADFAEDDGRFVLSYDKKYLAIINGARQGILMLDPCSLRVMATVQPPKPLSSSVGTQEESLKLVRFSNNAFELLAVSSSDRLYIFSLPSRTFVQSMPLLGQGSISALVMSANSKYMATGGVDGSLRVWNWDDRGQISRMHQSFLGHAGKINELGFTKDGKHLVATGESSAVCIWEFNGDPRPDSPRIRLGNTEGTNGSTNQTLNVGADVCCTFKKGSPGSQEKCGVAAAPIHDSFKENGPEEVSLGASTSFKSSFRLSLESDALMLGDTSENAKCNGVSSVLSSKTVREETPIVIVREMTDVDGRITLSSAIAGFNPSSFAWSCSTGKLLYATNSTLVVEDIASGQQAFYDDSEKGPDRSDAMIQCPTAEIVLLQLSPSGETVATISSLLDNISIRSLTSNNGDSGNEAPPATQAGDLGQILIRLLPGTSAVTALAFGQSYRRSSLDELICAACEIGGPQLKEHLIVLASTARGAIVWSSAHSTELQAKAIQQIVARSDSQFLLLSVEDNSVSSLSLRLNADGTDVSIELPDVELHSLIDAFPTQVQRVSLHKRRYLVGIDNDRYCYFYDLQRDMFIATTQLLIPSKTNVSGSLVNIKATTSPTRIVEFFEWVTTAGKSLFITGSAVESKIYVHALPTLSVKHSSGVLVDWQRLARGGVSLVCSIPLSGGGLLRSLSVDPARDVGIVMTEDGSVVVAHFESPPTTKVLRGTVITFTTAAGERDVRFAVAQASWALDGAVLLTLSQSDNAIRVWLPELSRELTRFQVASVSCTCFAVNPFQASSDGVPQSMVMAGYSDGSLRVFDLREMKLLSRFELTLSSAKSTRVKVDSFDRIVFVGASTALVVTNDHRVLLVDFTNALNTPEGAQTARGTNIRSTLPSRASATARKKITREKMKARATSSTGGRKTSQEVVYRELNLLSMRQSRRNRLPSVARTESAGRVEVGAIDVMHASDANIHPFLVVVRRSGSAQHGESKCVAVAFAESRMSDEMAPTDKWRLDVPELDHSAVVFSTASPGAVRALYPCLLQHAEMLSSATEEEDKDVRARWWWGLELRDCVQRCVIQRLAFDIGSPYLGCPVLLRCIEAALIPDSPEAEQLVLLADEEGRMAALDCTRRQLIPINSQSAQTSTLNLCSNASILSTSRGGNTLLLLSSSPSTRPSHLHEAQVAIGTLSFQT